MLRGATARRLASLRYQRPYWMLHLQGVDNWRIYEELQKDSNHQRVEMEYQAWLGGLDRPYVRPRCMAVQPTWLEKKRHALKRSDLQGPETPLERYVLEWEQRFFSFRGTLRPTPEDMHTAFDLVERPLDLSYAVQVLDWCRNDNDMRFARESFAIFVEACLRVDRKDAALLALESADKLGFWYVDPRVRAFLEGTGPDFRSAPPTAAAATTTTTTKTTAAPRPGDAAPAAAGALDDDEAALAAELAALEEEERRVAAEAASRAAPSSGGGGGGKDRKNS